MYKFQAGSIGLCIIKIPRAGLAGLTSPRYILGLTDGQDFVPLVLL